MIKKKLKFVCKTFFITLLILLFSFPLTAIDLSEKWEDGVKVALVLSGGGARGFAHIPIIEAIERHNIPIDIIVGTSMGALVGGIYASGYSPRDMIELINSYDMIELFAVAPAPFQKPILSTFADYRDNILNLSFDKRGVGRVSGLIGDQKILEMLTSSLINASAITNFNHLPVPFRCVGTDLVTGEQIIFSSGSLSESIRASISIPGIFTPAIVNNKLVIDGGLVNNLPIDIAKEMGADIIIAVDVNAVDYTVTKEELSSLTDILGQLAVILTKNTVVNQIDEADLLFSPLVEDYGILAFASYKEIIAIGASCAAQMDDALKKLSEQICAIRECNPINPDRKGSYFLLPEIEIDDVIHTPLNSEGVVPRVFPLKNFQQFTSNSFSKDDLRELHFLLNEERELHQYATVSHRLTNVRYDYQQKPHGILEIQTKEFEDRDSRFGVGVFGSTHLTYSGGSDFSFYFDPNFSLSYHTADFIIPHLKFSFNAVEKEFVELFADLSYTWKNTFRLGVFGTYQVGALHAYHASSSPLGYGADYAVKPTLFFEINSAPYLTTRVSAQVRSMWYENDPFSYTNRITPSIAFDGVYSRQKFTLFPKKGIRVDLSGTIFFREKIGYKMNIGVKQSLLLTHNDSLLFDIIVGSTHSIDAHVDDYFHYGGFDGIVTKLPNYVVRNMLIGGISYFHWFTTSPIPVVLKAGVKLGAKGQSAQEIYADDLSVIQTSPSISFSPEIDVVGSVGLGFSIRNTDILIGIAVDNNLSASLFVEVR